MGHIFKFHTDVDTDQIIASQYLLFPTIDEMKTHAFESLDPDFASRVKPGDFVVAAENFGCGSSREQAPSVLKALGVQAVIAKSFARIFYRNANQHRSPGTSSAGSSMIMLQTATRWTCLSPTASPAPADRSMSAPSFRPICRVSWIRAG